jgi:hypothetical protein
VTHKIEKSSEVSSFKSAGCSPLRAEGFSYSLNVLYGCLEISTEYRECNFRSKTYFFQV